MATKFITVSIEIMHDSNLSPNQKFILAEIEQLCSLKNGCIATNKHFSMLVGISVSGVSRAISDLQKNGYIEIDTSESVRNNGRIITIKKGIDSAQEGIDSAQEGIDSAQEGIDSAQEGIDSAQESKGNITNNTTNNRTPIQKSGDLKEIDTDKFNRLNSSQKIQTLQSKLNKHIGIIKTKIFKDDLLSAKEIIEQIEDPNDFVDAYLEHKKTLKDKKYLKGMFAFMAAYVDGEMKSAKNIEDDYIITIHESWFKREDGCFETNTGVINPFTGVMTPWEHYKEVL